MSNLQHRQQIIQEKRKQTPWRDFVMEIASWFPMNLYKNQGSISRFPDTSRAPKLIDHKKFEDIQNHEMEYDTGIGFFQQLSDMFKGSILPFTLTNSDCENSTYSDGVAASKNAYLCFSGACFENCFYSLNPKFATNVIASVGVWDKSENVFESSGIVKTFNCFYSHKIEGSSNIWFCKDLIGCSECIRCEGLANQSYCIENIHYEKEEYEKIKKEFLKHKEKFGDYVCSDTGTIQFNCYEVSNANYVYSVNDAHNCVMVAGKAEKNRLYDVFNGGNSGDYYGTVNAGGNSQYLYSFCHGGNCYMCFYSYFLNDCSFCLGCIGLKNKSYCILNKQYSKEERYIKVDEIFGKMDVDGSLGSFFPASMNPFYFNDTAAYLIDPSFTKEEVVAKGFLRRDEPIKVDIPPGVQTVKTSELEQFEGFDATGKWVINDEILKKVILDEQGNAYRVIPMELEFLRKYELPLPRKHWLDRMKENFRIG